MSDTAWRQRAACKRDPELFFPDGEGRAYKAAIEEAKAVCMSCPVYLNCFAYAIGPGRKEYGIWAAMTETERDELRMHESTDKRCTDCRDYKPLSDFYHRPGRGYETQCKKCKNRHTVAARTRTKTEAA